MPLAPAGSRFLSDRGYALEKIPENDALIKQLKEELTVKPRVPPGAPAGAGGEAFPVWRESKSKFYMPRIYGLERFGLPSDGCDRLSAFEPEPAPRLEFSGQLRHEQREPVRCFLEAARDLMRRGGLLVLGCAAGKTAMALYISTVLKVKTLVVCHKEFLMNQWVERIEMFVPTARVGRIKQARAIVEDCDIVIASLQSISMREYPPDVLSGFGFVVVDECHHISAEVFSRALPRITAPIMLGLSATPNRKDGLRKVFEWFIGKPAFTMKKREDRQMIIRMVRYTSEDPKWGNEVHMWNGKLNFAQMINQIAEFKPRNELIVEILTEILEREPGRRVMILSERRKQLEILDKMIRDKEIGSTGFYVGGMKQEDLDEATKRDILLATVTMAGEGFDCPALNTLVLASPITAVEQPVGRIQRQLPEQRQYTPLLIDIWDQFSVFERQGLRRITFYKKNGYTFEGVPDSGAATPTREEGKQQPQLDFVDDE